MITKSSPTTRVVVVREVPIELCAFIKFSGLAESGGQAKQLIAERGVRLNGAIETRNRRAGLRRKRKQLAVGDRVTVGLYTIVVSLV